MQVSKLLSLEHQALANGISYAIERDEQFSRVFWVFFYNVTPSSEVKFKPNFNQILGLWPCDANLFPLPLSRQQMMYFNQREEVVAKKRTEYSEIGGYVGSPQYWQSVEKAVTEGKAYKKICQQFQGGCNFEMF